jgi:septal ring factor EnvC (AmiA/AmiB activator)
MTSSQITKLKRDLAASERENKALRQQLRNAREREHELLEGYERQRTREPVGLMPRRG